MDCLDRTNVIESVYAREVLQTVVRSYTTLYLVIIVVKRQNVHYIVGAFWGVQSGVRRSHECENVSWYSLGNWYGVPFVPK